MNSEITHPKLIQINTVCNNSTGRIMHDIQIAADERGFNTLSIVGRRKPYYDVPCVKYGNFVSFWVHVFITTLFDKQGWGSYFITKKIVNRLRKEKPDIIHLHNVHGYFIHLPILFRYLCEEFQGKIFWTFHDCWPFTGHCPYYIVANCNRWKEECYNCPNKTLYPASYFFDSSKSNYRWKKENFLKLKDLTILVPSKWLYNQVQESFMSSIDTFIVENGIDLKVFYPREKNSVVSKYHVEGKRILLGVASIWDMRKGLADFIRISQAISDQYVIILVGLTRKQSLNLPRNIIGIPRTENAEELAQLYSASDIFINPSCEETFSLVTVEAMACGTPVIVRRGSAVEELVPDECGIVLPNGETSQYINAISRIAELNLDRKRITLYAGQYSKENMIQKVLTRYENRV